MVDSPWPGGHEVFSLASGGAKHFFGAVRGGANLFFCPPDVVFISDDHIINATYLTLIKLQENLLILVRLDLELKIEPLLLYIPGVLQTPPSPLL